MLINNKMKTKAIIIGFILMTNACTDDTELPTVTTSPITVVTWEYALTGGEVIDDGCSPVTARGVCVTTNQFGNPTLIENYETWHTTDSSGIGSFESEADIRWYGAALSIRDTHYIRAYATNNVGTAYGKELSFFPKDKPLRDNSIEIESITATATSALINYEFHYQIFYTVREKGICYNTSSNATVEGDHIIISNISEGSNSVTIENLISNITYYVRSYAKNESGIYYSSELSFTTSIK